MTDASFESTLVLCLFSLWGVAVAFAKRMPGRWTLLLPAALAALYLAAVPPFYHQVRHLLPLSGILVAAACAGVACFRIGAVLLPCLYLFFLVRSPFSSLVIPVLLPVVCIASAAFFILRGQARQGLTAGVAGTVLFAAAAGWAWWACSGRPLPYDEVKRAAWAKYYGDEGRFWAYVQRFTDTGNEGGKNPVKGVVIAYAGEFLLYPLFGAHLQNEVVYQSVNTVETLPVHRYPPGKVHMPDPPEERTAFYRSQPSFETWVTGLIKKRVGCIVIRTEKDLVEREWVSTRPDLFPLLFSNSYAEVYLARLYGDP